MTDLPLTLLQMQGASLEPPALDRTSLVIIDLQEEYRIGALPLFEIDAAVAEAARVLELARRHAMPIFHIWQEAPGAPIFNPDLPGFAAMAEVAPQAGETIVRKTLPNAFAKTSLHAGLQATGRPEVIFIGAMTHMCVSATTRAALDLGYRSTIVAGACATRPLPATDGGIVPAAEVHRTALAELADAFAIVVPDVTALQGARVAEFV